MNYRRDIDGLRTLAVVPVVFYHAGLGLGGGYIGVDVFFVISGYLITALLLRDLDEGRFSILSFYERRARRIFPALFVMFAVVTALAAVLLVPNDLREYGSSLFASGVFVANIFFWTREGYFTEAAELTPLLHMWSLGVEEQYYIFFPIILWALVRFFRQRAMLICVSTLAFLSFAMSIHAVNTAPDAAYYLPQYRAWELFLGSIQAIVVRRDLLIQQVPSAALEAFSVMGIVLIMVPVFMYSSETPFPGLAALPPCLGAALLLLSGHIRPNTSASRLISAPPMVFVGKLSFSFYLWHWPVIVFTYYVSGELTWLSGSFCVLVSFALAYLSYRLVETPFRDRQRFGKRMIAFSSMAAVVAAGVIGQSFYLADGYPGRLSPELQAFTDARTYLHDRRDCHFVTPERAASGDVCQRGSLNAEPSFILAGDSHADAFSPAVFAAAETLGLAGYHYTGPGFRPLPGVELRGVPEWSSETDAFIEFVRARPNIETIFVTAFWEHQVTGGSYRTSGGVWTDDAYDGSGSAYNPIATRRALRKLTTELPGVRLVLLDDVPTGLSLHIKEHIRSLWFKGAAFSELHTVIKGLPRDMADAQRATYEPLLLELSRNVDLIDYYPVFSDLCGEAFCPLFKDDVLIFRDGDHLSFSGALMLEGQAADMLRKKVEN